MGHLFLLLFQFLRRSLVLLTFIVLGLAAAPLIERESEKIQRIVKELPDLKRSQDQLNEQQAELVSTIAGQVSQLTSASVRSIDAAIADIDRKIAVLALEQKHALKLSAAVGGPGSLTERLQKAATLQIEIELQSQARSHLASLRAHAVVLEGRTAAKKKTEQLRAAHVKAYSAYQAARAQLVQLREKAGWLGRIPFSTSYLQLKDLQRGEQARAVETNRAYREFAAHRALIGTWKPLAAPTAFRPDEKRLALAGALLRDRLKEAERVAAQNYVWRTYIAVRPFLPAAFAILVAWWLVPPIIRTLFYFVIAPLATRRPPIVIAPDAHADRAAAPLHDCARRESTLISALSQQIKLSSSDEMLIRSDYCQSQPVGVRVTSKLLFDWRYCMTSVAAHLWTLKRLRSAQDANIVVSSTLDAFDEVALVELGRGESLVFHPRGLVGVVFKAGQRPAIGTHWRLGSMHAWLTLQLRYLVFEGPTTLIVKGCRGVRRESAAETRTISQDAVIGFSANVAYSTVRAEPFFPYLIGDQALFQDKFVGTNAYYLYEEVPRKARRHRNNPAGMFLEASLKAFGI